MFLEIVGVLTGAGSADAIPSVPFYAEGRAALTAIGGLGEQAGYVNDPGQEQSLQARSGSYLVELRVEGATPDVPEATMEPLVREVIGKL